MAHGCPKGWRKALCLNPPPQVPLWAHLPGTTSIFLKKLLPCFQACVLWAIFFWINSLCSILKSNSFKLFLNKSLFWIYCGPAKVAIVMPGSVRIITQLESPLYLIGIYAALGWQDFHLVSNFWNTRFHSLRSDQSSRIWLILLLYKSLKMRLIINEIVVIYD